MPKEASASPTAPPAIASSSASANIWLSSRHQSPPSAVRTAISRSRRELRTSSRFATLAHAISSRKITAPINAISAGFTSSTTCLCIGSTRNNMPAVFLMA